MQLLFLIVALTLIHIPTMASAAARNTLARHTAIDCRGNGAATAPGSEAGDTWFQAVSALCHGDEAAARAHFAEAIEQFPRRLPAIRILYAQDTALAQLAAQVYPQNPVAHFWLADAQRENDNAPAAIAAYQQGLSLAPLHAQGWMWLGRLQEEQGHLDDALNAFLQACRYVDPGRHGCRDAAAIYFERGDYANAAHYYERSIDQVPTHARTRRRLAETHLALGQATAAQPHLQWLADRDDAWAVEQLNNRPTNSRN